MKVLILSDIHSNIYALEAVWDRERDSDLIYCTGDLVDYGPYPKEVLNWIRSHDVVCTQGNHDQWVATCYRSGKTMESVPVEQRRWVHHNVSLLDTDDIEYLERLPKAVSLDIDSVPYVMTHLFEDYNEIVSLYAYSKFLDTLAAHRENCVTRLILGHTHRQAIRYLSDHLLWLNPGSASYRRPDDPDRRAHYAVLTDGIISLRRISYELAPLYRYIRNVRLKRSEISIAERFFGLSN